MKHNGTVRVVVSIVLLLMLSSCATWKQQVKDTLNPLLGELTYNDAVTRWGPPDQKEQLDDGRMVAVWVFSQETLAESFILTGLPAYRTITDKMTLTFDDQGILIKWRYNRQ